MDNSPLSGRQHAAFLFVLLLFVGSCLSVAWGLMYFRENKAQVCQKLPEAIKQTAVCK